MSEERRESRDERALRLERQRIELAERRLKTRLGTAILTIWGTFLLVRSLARGFWGVVIPVPEWQYTAPFVAAAMMAVFNFDMRKLAMRIFGLDDAKPDEGSWLGEHGQSDPPS